MRYSSALLGSLALIPLIAHAQSGDGALELWVSQCERLVPRQTADCSSQRAAEISKAADAIEQWAAETARFRTATRPEHAVLETDRLAGAAENVDQVLRDALALRTQFCDAPGQELSETRRAEVLAYLKIAALLTDLSGRMRYQMRDAVDAAAYRAAGRNDLRERLIDVLARHNSTIGAEVMGPALFDPAPEARNQAVPATRQCKRKLLQFIGRAGSIAQVYELADFLREPGVAPELTVLAAESIRQIGLPQDPRPGDAEDLPKPALTAAELHGILNRVVAAELPAEMRERRQSLLAWLAERMKHGLDSDRFRLGGFEVRPGDWLLMRNPSPYNLFTDLSPGLFTHVGVVAVEQGSDGKQRMVIVDLPERGTRIPATNVEIYVQRSLHYLFLRHRDPDQAAKMAAAAAAIIGNESVFDLNFRTDRVLPFRGKPLAGQKIHTFCTGLLLLCAQETTTPREVLFPVPEKVAPGRMAANMATLGVSLGDDFISPTSALFSKELEIAGRVSPYYDPGRQIEEGIFDHFTLQCQKRELAPSLDTFKSLRLKVAEAAKTNPALAKAIAGAANVSAEMDLVAAARTGGVVETLDEIAFGQSRQFRETWSALTSGPLEDLSAEGYSREEIARYRQLRQRDAELLRRFDAGQLAPRQLRIVLVDRFLAAGRAEIDKRFFSGPPQPK
ncbi:MAG: hypothetical protein HYS13_24900 [Planctomycetia bacterium]|nr:hypothetical protein [Planctomycetia bacterium]